MICDTAILRCLCISGRMEPETLIHHLVSPICVLCSTQTDVDFRVLCQLCICIDASGAILGMCKFLLRFSHLSASNIYQQLAGSSESGTYPKFVAESLSAVRFLKANLQVLAELRRLSLVYLLLRVVLPVVACGSVEHVCVRRGFRFFTAQRTQSSSCGVSCLSRAASSPE